MNNFIGQELNQPIVNLSLVESFSRFTLSDNQLLDGERHTHPYQIIFAMTSGEKITWRWGKLSDEEGAEVEFENNPADKFRNKVYFHLLQLCKDPLAASINKEILGI